MVLFKDNASLRRNAKKVAEKSIVMPAGGFYMTYEHTLCAEVTMGPWLVRHELTHALVHGDFGSKKPAPWFDEGMAMMVESAVIEGKKLTFRADRRLNLVHRLMKARKLPKLKDVLKMDFRTYNAPATRATADALSRCLMLYLDEKGLLVKFYRRYRIRYRRDPTATKFVEELLEKDIDAVETDLLAWVQAKVRESRESTKKPSSKEPAKPPEMGHKPRKTETVAAIQREKLAIMSS